MDERPSGKGRMVVTAVAAIFLCLLAVFDYEAPTEKYFGPESFYQGSEEELSDPKAQYDAFYNGKIDPQLSCKIVPDASKSLLYVNNVIWVAEKSVKNDTVNPLYEDINYAKDTDGNKISTALQPYSDGDKIVCPDTIEFINSNIGQGSGVITISGKVGTSFVVEWSDVKTWWCHIGKEDPTKHSKQIGAGGVGGSEEQPAGTIIGEAKSTTTVTIYKKDANGVLVPIPPTEFYSLPEVSPTA